MKLNKVYTNNDKIFIPIKFNPGLNVLYAKVYHPKDMKLNSHCLGKTLLIDLIDFLLIKETNKNIFLIKHNDRFHNMVFYLEIALNSGSFVTIKRSVDEPSKIWLIQHNYGNSNMLDMPDSEWQLTSAPVKKAKQTLNELLSLDVIPPEDYRKGVGYFLRKQKDYLDEFQIEKFKLGLHQYWKPFMAQLLGFDPYLLKEKYDIDALIERKTTARDEISITASVKSGEFDKVKGTLQIERAEVDTIRQQVDRFSFYEQEIAMNRELVDHIENEVANLNNALYTARYEIEKIQKSLQTSSSFDLEAVEQLFSEINVHFPLALKHNYEDLIAFNNKIHQERNNRLKERNESLISEITGIDRQLRLLNQKRESMLGFLQERDSFCKFKAYQDDITKREAHISRLEAKLESLDQLASLNREIQELVEKRHDLINMINETVIKGSKSYESIRQRFDEILFVILGQHALISIVVNKEGNLDFSTTLLHTDDWSSISSEGDGTSYKKLMCAAFDIAMLETYSNSNFYRFVYHDGLLEGFDNRIKCNVLRVISEYCDVYGLQHILTVIEDDLPRDDKGEKVRFPQDIIIREFHDNGDDGRLFNMPKF